jgi:sugar/nucleoside kinase (ribokinase family)
MFLFAIFIYTLQQNLQEKILGLLIVGSLGLDTVTTPFDKVEDALGGSATYISLAASYFSGPIRLVGVVGNDFPEEYVKLLEEHKVDLEGLQKIEGGKTFRWGGKYHYDLNVRDTLFTELNVFESFDPIIPENFRKSKYVCLGNIDPTLQLKVEGKKDELLELLKKVHVLIINDSEARLLANEPNLIKASKMIRQLGPEILIIKKGEHGAMLFTDNTVFSAPAYPMETIFDPTGAGDSFAGGFIGYLFKSRDLSPNNLKAAVIYGSSMASFCVEKFSTKGLEELSYLQVQDRYRGFLNITKFDDAE